MQERLTQEENTEMMDKAKSVIILYLKDKVFREFSREKLILKYGLSLTHFIWSSSWLIHRLCYKQQLYSFWMVKNKFIFE